MVATPHWRTNQGRRPVWVGVPRRRPFFLQCAGRSPGYDAPLRRSAGSRWSEVAIRDQGAMKTNEGAMDMALLCLRLALGAIFIVHGGQKLFGPSFLGGEGMAAFTATVESLQVPAPRVMAYVAAVSEFGGGILVVLGLFARIGGLAIAGVMIVAIVKVHLKNGFLAKNNGFENPLALLCMALAIAIAGEGRLS